MQEILPSERSKRVALKKSAFTKAFTKCSVYSKKDSVTCDFLGFNFFSQHLFCIKLVNSCFSKNISIAMTISGNFTGSIKLWNTVKSSEMIHKNFNLFQVSDSFLHSLKIWRGTKKELWLNIGKVEIEQSTVRPVSHTGHKKNCS